MFYWKTSVEGLFGGKVMRKKCPCRLRYSVSRGILIGEFLDDSHYSIQGRRILVWHGCETIRPLLNPELIFRIPGEPPGLSRRPQPVILFTVLLLNCSLLYPPKGGLGKGGYRTERVSWCVGQGGPT